MCFLYVQLSTCRTLDRNEIETMAFLFRPLFFPTQPLFLVERERREKTNTSKSLFSPFSFSYPRFSLKKRQTLVYCLFSYRIVSPQEEERREKERKNVSQSAFGHVFSYPHFRAKGIEETSV